MEFEELQRKWASQNEKDMYTIDLEATRQRIRKKKAGATLFSERVEQFLISVYLIAGGAVLVTALKIQDDDWDSYLVASAMLSMAAYVIYVRMARLRASGTFDRSLQGDVDQAISDTRHRVRISRISLWFIPFIGITITFQSWVNGKPVWGIILLVLFFIGTYFAGRLEHSRWHLGRLKELEQLKQELIKAEL